MKQSVLVYVVRPDVQHVGQFKQIYKNSIECDDSLDLDYKTLIKGLRMLYPSPDVIIEFHLM